MRDTDLYKTLLGLVEPWEIDGVNVNTAAQTITVRVRLGAGRRLACPACGRADCAIKDRQERTWRHLDTCQFQTLIAAALPRTDCPACGVKTIIPPWAEARSRFTALFERFAISMLLETSISGACALLRVTWDEANGILERAVGRGLSRRDLSGLRRIGIDEKAVLRGHHYITVVYDLETSKVVWVGKDRTENTLDGFFKSLPEGVVARIECITMDMWEPYRAACRKWIPDADEKTVLDRFHITRHLNEAVNDVRKQEHRSLMARGIDWLKGSKWDWLYNPENLPRKRVPWFRWLRGLELKTGRAHAIKETFRHFWSYRLTGNARRFFGRWYFWATHSRLEPMIKVARRLHRRLDRILTFFTLGATNSTAEGINNKIQTVKKKAYGFRNIHRFMNAVYFHCGGLSLFPQ